MTKKVVRVTVLQPANLKASWLTGDFFCQSCHMTGHAQPCDQQDCEAKDRKHVHCIACGGVMSD